MYLSLIVLLMVLVLIAMRRLGRWEIRIWQAMAAGALAVLITGQISLDAAWHAIDIDVILFLGGMFIIGQALVSSGWLFAIAYRLFGHCRSSTSLVLTLLFGGGLASALLMNDTLAIVGTPLVLRLAREHRINPRLLLLTLCFAITTGSVVSPIGNPQNLLIALHGEMDSPFVTFLSHLAIPTLLALLLAYGVLRVLFHREFHRVPLTHVNAPPTDAALARLARTSVWLLCLLIALKITLASVVPNHSLPLSYIALVAATPLLLFSPRRRELLRSMDWTTLLFFAAMFVLMASVWQTGLLQQLLTHNGLEPKQPATVLGVSVLLSQLISNVPLVALYLPLLSGVNTSTLLVLAAGSTIAGNLLLMGAASNVIVAQGAERHGSPLGFGDFARAGIPLTLLQGLLYWLFLVHPIA